MRDRVRSDDDVGGHREEEGDPITLLHAEPYQCLRELRDAPGQFAERQLSPVSILAAFDDGDGRRTSFGPAMNAVPSDIQPSTDKPGGPLRAAAEVDDFLPSFVELERHVVDDEWPEPIGVLARAVSQFLPLVEAASAE